MGAEEEFRRALELNPSNATAHHWYASFLLRVGRFDEALLEIKAAYQHDPLSPIVGVRYGEFLALNGEYDESRKLLLRIASMHPNVPRVYQELGRVYSREEKYEEAVAACEKALELAGKDSIHYQAVLAAVYGRVGRQAEARALLHGLIQRSERAYVHPASIAHIYMNLGELDRAFEWIETALEERDPIIRILLTLAPSPLREDPRFGHALKRIGLPVQKA